MKYKFENLSDITESREIMQSKPQGFSKYMTYIVIALLVLVFIWSLIAKKEVYIVAPGVVETSGKETSISSNATGNVSKVNVKDGDVVKKGDVLFTINGSEYIIQRNTLKNSLDKNTNELKCINLLKKSILDGKSEFDLSDDTENEYYKKYEIYLSNYNLSSSNVNSVNKQKDDINNNISKLNLFKQAIQDNTNYFSEGDSYYYQYKDYEIIINNYDLTLKDYENQISKLKDSRSSENATSIDNEISNLENNINSSKDEKEKYINTTLMNIATKIDEYKNSLSTLTVAASADTYKEEYLNNLESSILTLKNNIDTQRANLEIINEKIDDTSVKAPSNGIVSMIADVKIGTYLTQGNEIANIVPENKSGYEVSIYISNNSFTNIKEGEDVVVEFPSLPSSTYGHFNSKLSDISVTASKTDNKGNSYYTAKCKINKKYLYSKSGGKIKIKDGMVASVRIVNRKVSYFKYFLESIDIIDK